MIREHLFSKTAPTDTHFRWRGGDVSRLEGLADGVFAVTLTLLIASLQVPDTFFHLWETLKAVPVFLACFMMVMWLWRYHYLFFRRYGLEDLQTSVLNAAFLFLVVFYAYPLKFLASFLWKLILREDTGPMFALPPGVVWQQGEMFQRAGMLYFYGLGLAGVFAILGLMAFHAHRRREELELDEVEQFLTVSSIRSSGISVGVALLSMTVLFFSGNPGASGIVYFLMGPLHAADGYYTGYRSAKIRERLTS